MCKGVFSNILIKKRKAFSFRMLEKFYISRGTVGVYYTLQTAVYYLIDIEDWKEKRGEKLLSLVGMMGAK